MGDVDLVALEQAIRGPFRSGGAKVRDADGSVVFLARQHGPERTPKTRGRADIHLGALQLGDIGAKLVAGELRTNTDCVSLWLQANAITDAGATELARGLRANTTLRVLDLHANRIADAGAAELARALRAGTTLRVLNLSGNALAAPLPPGLARHPTLRTLCFEAPPPPPLVPHPQWTTSSAQVAQSGRRAAGGGGAGRADSDGMQRFTWAAGPGGGGAAPLVGRAPARDRRDVPTLFPGLAPRRGLVSGPSKGVPEFDPLWKERAHEEP